MTTRRAALLLRSALVYRREVFAAGLKRLGYEVQDKHFLNPNPGDLLVLWNRSRFQEMTAQRFEHRGGTVVVAENGYIGHDDDGGRLFAMAKRFHNGAGEWPVGDRARWERQHIELGPWRSDGEVLLVLPQRGIGPPGIAMPGHWEKIIRKRLEQRSVRSVRVRPHPGSFKSEPYKDFRNCYAVVTWGSGAAIKAIAAGIPSFHEMPNWIGSLASRFIEKRCRFDDPWMGDRVPMFERLAWAQFSTSEIESGFAFSWLLQ